MQITVETEQKKLIEKYKGKSLADLFPNIAAEWNYEKNYPLTPYMVTKGMNKKVWWLCSNGHSYESLINSRTSNNNNGCPYCSGRLPIQGENDLATTHPNLAKEWYYEKNYPLTPQMVSQGSVKKVWWICKEGHSYKSQIYNRANNSDCPYCSGRLPIQGENDLATTHPNLCKEWDYERNGSLTPQMVSKGSNKKVWWLCPNGHSYESTIAHRTNNRHCPYCSGKKVWQGYNDLFTTHPDLCKEWDYNKNGSLTPQQVSKGSTKKVWWICSKNHSYEMQINVKTYQNLGCPICSGHQILQGYNDLETIYPDIAKEWDYEKNGTLTPQQVTKGNNKKVWWKCIHGHSFLTSIFSRTSLNSGCPICGMSKGERFIYELLTKHNIPFSREYKFTHINEVRFYPFDFYLYDYKLIIEYDGNQHFNFNSSFYYKNKRNFKTRVKHDNIKNEFCLKHNISILRIPYIYNPETDSDKIINLVATFVKTKKVSQEIIDFYSQYDFSNYAGIATELNNKIF